MAAAGATLFGDDTSAAASRSDRASRLQQDPEHRTSIEVAQTGPSKNAARPGGLIDVNCEGPLRIGQELSSGDGEL